MDLKKIRDDLYKNIIRSVGFKLIDKNTDILKKTTACRYTAVGCKFHNCSFAHSADEITARMCPFDDACIKNTCDNFHSEDEIPSKEDLWFASLSMIKPLHPLVLDEPKTRKRGASSLKELVNPSKKLCLENKLDSFKDDVKTNKEPVNLSKARGFLASLSGVKKSTNEVNITDDNNQDYQHMIQRVDDTLTQPFMVDTIGDLTYDQLMSKQLYNPHSNHQVDNPLSNDDIIEVSFFTSISHLSKITTLLTEIQSKAIIKMK